MQNDEYILRSDAISAFCGNCEATEVCRQIGEPCEEVKQIKAIPAADVEPVVYCRDCKYRDQKIPVHNAICTKCYGMDCRNGYGFCSMGERMEEDDART